MALSSTCLWASLTEVKHWLRLSPADVAHDVVLEQLAHSVTEELEAMAGRVAVSRAITERFDSHVTTGAQRGQYVYRFTLRGYPVTTNPLTTFTIDGVAVDADDYVLDAEGGRVQLLTGYSSEDGISDVVITYTAGYARASLPSRVTQIGLDMLAVRYSDWSAGANAAQSVQFGNQGYTPRSSWSYQIKDAIVEWRNEIRGGTIA